MGDCQNYGPFLGPYYNTGPNMGPNLGDPKRDHNFHNPPHKFMDMGSLLRTTLGTIQNYKRDPTSMFTVPEKGKY